MLSPQTQGGREVALSLVESRLASGASMADHRKVVIAALKKVTELPARP